jgi:actin related protein 2/3 complex subunit 3
LKTRYRGPAPIPADPTAMDIIDECLDLFRANCLFRNFEIYGDGDRTLIYGILYISECLNRLAASRPATKQEAQKTLQTHALSHFAIPGDPTFNLNAIYPTPTQRTDAELLRQYLQQFRQELSDRLVERVYAQGHLSKWWMSFQKRKFLGKTLQGH